MEYRNSDRSRLLIADDHTLVAEAFKNLLEPEFQVLAIVTDGRALMRAASELKPAVIIFDISMPLLNGLDACEHLKKILPSAKLLYLTMNIECRRCGRNIKTRSLRVLAKDRARRGANYCGPGGRTVHRGHGTVSPPTRNMSRRRILRNGSGRRFN